MNTLAFPQQLAPSVQRTSSVTLRPDASGAARQWALRLLAPLRASHCEDCGAPRGPDGRFTCESE